MEASFDFDRVDGLELLVCRPFQDMRVPHGFSLRRRRRDDGGAEPFGLPDRFDADRREMAIKLGLDGVVSMQQVHGTRLEVVVKATAQPPVCDGILTRETDIGLMVQTADCVPVLLCDPEIGVVAAIHAGWRGTLGGIVEAAVEPFATNFGSRPSSIHAALGPSIGACCYEVGDEVARSFVEQSGGHEDLFSEGARQRMHLDLIEANRRQLMAAGVPGSQIYAARLCTACNIETLFSYRREGTGAGRLYGVIGINS
jgi:YfiH family protein